MSSISGPERRIAFVGSVRAVEERVRSRYDDILLPRMMIEPRPEHAGGGGLQGGWGGVLDIMHGRSRMITDPRIPTLPGRSTSSFHRPGRHCLYHTRKGREVSGESHEG